jgi:hypothetical protein
MRPLKHLLIGLIVTLTGSAPLLAAELQTGFLGIKWGTSISELAHFAKISERNDVSYYVDPQKSYTLFEIDIPGVIYGFYEGKFFAAYVNVETIDLFNQLKNQLNQKYGSPRTTLDVIKDQKIYNWKYQDTKIKLKLYEKERIMKLGFYNTSLSKRVNKAQREAFPQPRQPAFPLNERRLKDAIDVMGF